ncbi:hypothetical protein Pth03_52950 [Planotetraspora thailandica]|uniref:SnoaL-like domain-containing protein n=1 Tax=Planotetraspora thailandica TaxID=487172 RepID=A0A8J3V4V6_9ACTN|nr:nuclear transport factor 2 family protein [Planotetraspora thailandica]GII56906.1 hypothetical protein Pth03_52950 [Planotetraspora thailandica]
MTSDDEEFADGLVGALNAHDPEAVADHFAPRATYVCPGGIAEGREEIASYFALYFEGFPDIRITPHGRSRMDDLVVMEWTLTSTHTGPFLLPNGQIAKPSGRRVAVRGCDFRTMDDGRISSLRAYYDQLEMLSQIGVPLL